jgi:hypothetical protein
MVIWDLGFGIWDFSILTLKFKSAIAPFMAEKFTGKFSLKIPLHPFDNLN